MPKGKEKCANGKGNGREIPLPPPPNPGTFLHPPRCRPPRKIKPALSPSEHSRRSDKRKPLSHPSLRKHRRVRLLHRRRGGECRGEKLPPSAESSLQLFWNLRRPSMPEYNRFGAFDARRWQNTIVLELRQTHYLLTYKLYHQSYYRLYSKRVCLSGILR